MMRLEDVKKIKVACFDINIAPWDQKSANAQRRFAEFSANELLIRVDETIVPVKMVDSLLHELGHAIYWVYGLEDDDKEERLVSTFATAWTQIYRDNPHLLTFVAAMLDETDSG